jgi:hypothetical protein
MARRCLLWHRSKGRMTMGVLLKIDRALYEVDDSSRTYRYSGRNGDWRKLDPRENSRNKKRIDGYTRIFADGKRKVFAYNGE